MSRSCVVIRRVIQVDHAHEERLVALALTFFILMNTSRYLSSFSLKDHLPPQFIAIPRIRQPPQLACSLKVNNH